jgi:hypothetical protein
MLTALWIASALAGSAPLVEGHVVALSSFSDAQGAPGVGGGAAFGVNAFGPLWMEAVLEGAWTPTSGPRVAMWPRLRVFATPRDESARAALSFAAGAGIQVLPTPARGQFELSSALDLRVAHNVALRLEGGWAPTTTTLGATRFALGVVWTRRRDSAPVVEEAVTQPWLPFPECRFVGPAEASAYFGDDVAPSPADHGDAPTAVAAPGPKVDAPPPEGAVWITPGSGEIAPSELQFAGHTVWARRLPPAYSVVFALADARLTADDAAQIGALAGAPGVVWRVHGSYSTEGDLELNRALGLARANAVRDVLLRAGVPASRILSTDVVAPDDTATPESQRSATVVAELPPEVTP